MSKKSLFLILSLFLVVSIFTGCDTDGKNDKSFPDVSLIYNINEGHKRIAEAVLEMWKQNLGIDNIIISNQEGAVFNNSRQNGDFQIALSIWAGDYNDPMTFIDLFTTGNGNNIAQWSNKKFDALIEKAKVASTEKERMEFLHQAENLIMEDVIIIPLFYYTENVLVKSYIKNLHKSPLGFTYFDKAYFVNEIAEKKTKFIRHNNGSQPESIDPALNTTVNGGTLIIANFEGLTSLDENENPIPGVAEKWDISPDKTKFTFYLRKDAKWSDGEPVTAKDFEYAWKRTLAPETAAPYAYQLFYIKNAFKFYQGEAKVEDLGIKVIDEYTLEVELEAPTPYFLKLTAFPTLFPVREDIIVKHGDQWARNYKTYIGNGPFKMVEWKNRDMMKFVRNEKYWNNKNIKIDGFIETFIPEASTMLSAFEAGELDVIDEVPLEEIDRLKNESEEFHMIPQLGTYFYCFNVTEPPFDNIKVRKAFALAIDREDIVRKVRKSGIPATALVPPGVPDIDGKDFRQQGGEFFPIKARPEEAKKLLIEAGY